MALGSIEILKNNCREYARVGKSTEVLRNANGRNHYTEIAEIVGIHQTQVSSLLKKAEKLGLAKKMRAGVYKKIPGILGYMPPKRKTKSNHSKTVQDIIQKVSKGRKNKGKSLSSSGLAVPSNIEMNLSKMASSYEALYAVENVLRELVRKVLGQEADWWKNYVPIGIRNEVGDIIKREPYHAVKRNDELEYTHLGQLKEIIIYKKNWSDFLSHLYEKNKNSFAVTIDKAIPSRNAIGHCIPLKVVDLKVVDVRFGDILRMIK